MVLSLAGNTHKSTSTDLFGGRDSLPFPLLGSGGSCMHSILLPVLPYPHLHPHPFVPFMGIGAIISAWSFWDGWSNGCDSNHICTS